ncbi:FimV/HubP family polar landmark protein [Aquirhabdus sp.]|uniref:FimV/HubP family polar landmark protein n=1 Tax=Aquirhabdus sp. TaxID=2824160 RepID=UPI00396CB557
MNKDTSDIVLHAKNNVQRTFRRLTILASTTLLASPAVFAADDEGTFLNLGIPGWVLGLVVVAILIGIALIPIKPKDQSAKESPKKTKAKTPVTQPPVVEPVSPTEITPPVQSTAKPIEAAAFEATLAPEIDEAPAPVIEETNIAVDALQEAKQLLVAQRYPQAVGVLSKGLLKEPERSDLMLELLVIYLKQNDHESFDAQFDQLEKLDDPIALIQAEELRDQLERKPEQTDNEGFIDFHHTAAVSTAPTETPPVPEPTVHHDGLEFTLDTPIQATPSTPVAKASETDFLALDQEFTLDTIDSHTSDSTPTLELHSPHEIPLDLSPVEPLDKVKPDHAIPEKDPVVFESDDLIFENLTTEFKETKPTSDQSVVPAAQAKEPQHVEGELVDLEFDLDESFALDQDKQEPNAKDSLDWTTDLADENFALPSAKVTEPALATPEVVPAASIESVPVVALHTTPVAEDSPADQLLSSLESEFPFLKSIDVHQTRLDLARNYIALGEINSARELLSEVATQGAATQQTEARELISKLAS